MSKVSGRVGSFCVMCILLLALNRFIISFRVLVWLPPYLSIADIVVGCLVWSLSLIR